MMLAALVSFLVAFAGTLLILRLVLVCGWLEDPPGGDVSRRLALAAAATLATACQSAPTPPAPVVTTTAPTTAPTTTTTLAPTTTSTTHPPRAARRRAASVAPVAPVAAVVATGDVEAAICAAWGAECSRALRVARCESGLRPDARNGPHAGLFQVNTRIHAARIARMGFTTAQMYEAGPNIAVAHALWTEQGWRPWTCAA